MSCNSRFALYVTIHSSFIICEQIARNICYKYECSRPRALCTLQSSSVAVACCCSHTQLSSLCDEPQLWCLKIVLVYIYYLYSIALVLLLINSPSDNGMSVLVILSIFSYYFLIMFMLIKTQLYFFLRITC